MRRRRRRGGEEENKEKEEGEEGEGGGGGENKYTINCILKVPTNVIKNESSVDYCE